MSSSDEAVIEGQFPVVLRDGMRSSMAGNNNLRQQALSPSVESELVAVGAGLTSPQSLPSSSRSSVARSRVVASAVEAASIAAGGVSAIPATRIGRVIKKPVRLEQQTPGRQTLAGRSGRADAPAKLAARAAAEAASAAAAAATTVVAKEPAVGFWSANGKAGSQLRGGSSVVMEAAAAAARAAAMATGKAERCVARLGTAAGSDGVSTGTRNVLPWASTSSSSIGDVGVSKGSSVVGVAPSSSTTGSVVKMALPVEGCSAGLALRRKDGEAGGAGGGSGDTSKRSRGGGRERDRLVMLETPPERPVGGFGPAPEDAIKEYKRAFDDVREGGITPRTYDMLPNFVTPVVLNSTRDRRWVAARRTNVVMQCEASSTAMHSCRRLLGALAYLPTSPTISQPTLPSPKRPRASCLKARIFVVTASPFVFHLRTKRPAFHYFCKVPHTRSPTRRLLANHPLLLLASCGTGCVARA